MASDEELAEAHATIARQAIELERLRAAGADAQFAASLRTALERAAIGGAIAAPGAHRRLLELIVETAAAVTDADAAALFLIDESIGELRFEVALGEKGEEAKQFTVPLGTGVAGLVAVSGQPMAIADARNDPRHAGDIADAVGYRPNTIACVPMFSHEEVIGVLECLDKREGTFSAGDLDVLGLFANQAAAAIEQSLLGRTIESAVRGVIERALPEESAARTALVAGASDLAERMGADPHLTRSLDLAETVAAIAASGEHGARLAETVLEALAGYVRTVEGDGS